MVAMLMRFDLVISSWELNSARGFQVPSAELIQTQTAAQKPARREAILLERFKGHTAAVTSVLVTSDAGAVITKCNVCMRLKGNMPYCLHVLFICGSARLMTIV